MADASTLRRSSEKWNWELLDSQAKFRAHRERHEKELKVNKESFEKLRTDIDLANKNYAQWKKTLYSFVAENRKLKDENQALRKEMREATGDAYLRHPAQAFWALNSNQSKSWSSYGEARYSPGDVGGGGAAKLSS